LAQLIVAALILHRRGKEGLSKRAIAKELGISRTSVIRLLRSRRR
jgi:DNA-binding transcriptional regulator LsrR (DeoR family)